MQAGCGPAAGSGGDDRSAEPMRSSFYDPETGPIVGVTCKSGPASPPPSLGQWNPLRLLETTKPKCPPLVPNNDEFWSDVEVDDVPTDAVNDSSHRAGTVLSAGGGTQLGLGYHESRDPRETMTCVGDSHDDK